MMQIVDALAEVYGPDVRNKVTFEPDARMQAQFASYPPVECAEALAE